MQDSRARLNKASLAIDQYSKQVSRNAHALIGSHQKLLLLKKTLLHDRSLNFLQVQNKEVNNLEKIINVMNPVHVIKRGYSITTVNGKLVKSVSDLAPGNKITTVLKDGSIESEVNTIKNSTET
jgi:exodeoxyribonuclease VII large subunit